MDGTNYFEFLPGEYQGQCWVDGSVFLSEEVFTYIEPIIERHEPTFDHYDFIPIHRATWARILTDLDLVAERLSAATSAGDIQGELRFLYPRLAEEFGADFRNNARRLSATVIELSGWLRARLQQHPTISILGM